MKAKIEIEIGKIRVTTDAHNTGYFYFDWHATINGKKKKGSYDSSYSSQSASSIRGKLKRGFAVQLAVNDLFGF